MQELDNIREAFLERVARVYYENEADELQNYCFVTPNKRTGTFLLRYFKDQLSDESSVSIAPEITTISDFVTSFTDLIEASSIEMLFILYDVYSKILADNASQDAKQRGEHLLDFNKFQHWGSILVSDFSDVDKYLVDASKLFKNVEALKEISSNYLTEEQIEILRRYWREEDLPQPAEDFWNHVIYKSGRRIDRKPHTGGFVKLWQVLNELYTTFRSRLRDKGLAYSGMIYRDALDELLRRGAADFPYKRYVFVGFNVLSASERKIFSRLSQLGIADFYWDYDSPVFDIPSSTATRFLKNQVKEFKSRYDIGSINKYYPDVEIIAIPSTIGQIKSIPNIIKGLHPELYDEKGNIDKDKSQDSLFDTAVVMPEERLCLPLLRSLPTGLNNLNITMGFPLRNAPLHTLMRNIVSMQLRARMLKFDNTFYYEDVIALLTNSLVRMASPDVCDDLITMIDRRRLFNIPVKELEKEEYQALHPLFRVVSNVNDSDAVFGYLGDLIAWLRKLVEQRYRSSKDSEPANEVKEEDGDSVSDANTRYALEIGFLQSYSDSLAILKSLDAAYLRNNRVYMSDKTVFHLVERIFSQQTIRFEGVPLKGLQIMGVLETRNLDFDNVIIMSMNERVFPRRHYSKSMIPNALRRAYAMSTLEHQESIYAYYFYSMISRARRVFLLYDGRNQGAKSGQPSRYINQVKFIFPPEKVKFTPLNYSLIPYGSVDSGVVKTNGIMQRLEKFRQHGSGANLSATSLNSYINCPYQFYLMYIEKFYEVDELKDYMDDSTYGTIIHETIQWIYEEELQKRGGKMLNVDVATIEKLSSKAVIEHHLRRSIKKNYLRRDPDDAMPLYGDSLLFHKVMTVQIKYMFEREKEIVPFAFVSAETGGPIRFKVSDAMSINLTYRIDRVDRIIDKKGQPYIRLIDYKTGADVTEARSTGSLFDGEEPYRNKALFQLLLYSNAYAMDNNYDGRIEPMLYMLRRMAVNGIDNFTISGAEMSQRSRFPITDYRDVNKTFMALLETKLKELFDRNIPFRPTPSEHHCKFCQFMDVCAVAHRPKR